MGKRLSRKRKAPAAATPFSGPGEIRALCRGLDWSATPLGPPERWPQSLQVAIRLCLGARFPMAVWAGPDLRLIYNDGYLPVLGPGRHPWALGRPAREVWPTVWDSQIGPELARAMGGESTWHEDERFVLPRGGRDEETFFTYSLMPIQEAGGKVVGVLNVLQETTERVRILGEHAARFRAIFDSASDAIVITDPASGGRVHAANPAACHLFGYTEEEFRGIARAAMMDLADPAFDRMVRERDERGRADATLTYFRKDGTRFRGDLRSAFFFDARGSQLETAIIRDTTQRQQAEEELRRSRDTLQAILDAAPAAVVMADAQGRILLASAATRDILGGPVTGDAHGPRGGYRLCRADGTDVPAGQLPLSQALANQPVAGEELLVMRADGTQRTILASATPLRAEDGTVLGAITVFQDVSERQRAEEALRAANEKLREADRRKNEFLGVLSHELRNPLTPIKNSLYILDRAIPGSDQARRAQAVVARQVDQLARLVDDLLDVTRISRGKIHLQRQQVELNELVWRTLEDHRPMFEKAGVRLELEAAPAPLFVDADWNRLAQVVGNLLQNAVKFTAPQGCVTVSVSAASGAGRGVVRVADTGVGMTPEVVERLFEPFMQADRSLDRSKGGLGLGLALVKGLVELHGGEIAAESPGLGKGSVFTVQLPLKSPSEVRPAAERRRLSNARRRVLVIEDNLDAAQSLRELLEMENQEVANASNGPDGIARARTFRPDLVLCDIGLPGMDGYEVARAFRADEVLKGTVLVAVSGYALPEDVQQAAQAGFDRHLAKPPSLEQLHQLLAELPGFRGPERTK